MVAFPVATAFTVPSEETVATPESELLQLSAVVTPLSFSWQTSA